MMRSGFAAALLTAGLAGLALAGPALAAADGPGDPAYGRRLALDLCADCHVVTRDGDAGGGAGPDLVERMRDPGVTEMALRSYLQTSHPVMPNIRLTREQTDDIVAYLVSLSR